MQRLALRKRRPHIRNQPGKPTALKHLRSKVPPRPTHQVTGNLDLHGVEKSITFPAHIEVGDGSAKATASFKINRKDFGITHAGMAEDLIKDDVLLEMSFAFAAS